MRAPSLSPPRGERRNIPLGHWLPVMLWVSVMFFLSSLPDPEALLGPRLMSLGDFILHGGGFVVLAMLVSRVAFLMADGFGLRPIGWALLCCAGYGLFDELHQILVPGRSFAWTDWLADLGGALVGGALVWVIGALVARQRGKGTT